MRESAPVRAPAKEPAKNSPSKQAPEPPQPERVVKEQKGQKTESKQRALVNEEDKITGKEAVKFFSDFLACVSRVQGRSGDKESSVNTAM